MTWTSKHLGFCSDVLLSLKKILGVE